MATIVNRRRGTNAQNATFTGAEGEFIYLTDEKRVVTHDGIVAGGEKQAKLSEVELVANKSTAVGLGVSNTLYPTQNAVKTYVDAATTAGAPPFTDTTPLVKGSVTPTKLLRFEVDGFTAATTRVITPPNVDITLAGINISQTFALTQAFTDGFTVGIESSLDDTSGLLVGIFSLATPTQLAIDGSANFASGAFTISQSGVTEIGPIINAIPLEISQLLTGSSDNNAFHLLANWDTTGTPSAIKLDVTNVASNSASRLLDLQVNSAAKFFVGLDGSAVSTGVEFDLGSTANANNTIKFVRPAAAGINMIDFDAISGAPNLSFLRKYTASPFRMELASPTDVDIVIDSNNDSSANLFRVLTNGINNAGTLLFSVDEAGSAITLGALTAGNTLFNVTATTGVLRLGNGTDPAANPTNATTQWAVGGEWQYRSSAAAEGAGQTNRVHNRAAQVTGVGTNYTLTNALARVDFGTTDPEIVLPTAGTYLVQAMVQFQADALSASDGHIAVIRNSTDSVYVGAGMAVSLGASFFGSLSLAEVLTVTASKTLQIWAFNPNAARGVVIAVNTTLNYVRLY